MKKEKLEKRIYELEIELEACLERGFNFSVSQIEEEIKQLNKLLKNYEK